MPRLRMLAAASIAALMLAACGATSTPSPSTALQPSASAAGSPSGAESPSASTEASPSESSAAGGPSASLNQVVVQFKDVGGSKITGGAFVTAIGTTQTAVSIGVIAVGVKDPMPAGIYAGTCPDVTGTALFKLGDLTTGASNTVIDTSIDDLTSSPHAIAIHDPKTPTKVVSCGDITK